MFKVVSWTSIKWLFFTFKPVTQPQRRWISLPSARPSSSMFMHCHFLMPDSEWVVSMWNLISFLPGLKKGNCVQHFYCIFRWDNPSCYRPGWDQMQNQPALTAPWSIKWHLKPMKTSWALSMASIKNPKKNNIAGFKRGEGRFSFIKSHNLLTQEVRLLPTNRGQHMHSMTPSVDCEEAESWSKRSANSFSNSLRRQTPHNFQILKI